MVANVSAVLQTQNADELGHALRITLAEFMLHPPDHMEWVDGHLVEKPSVSLQHSEIILNLGAQWRSYAIAQKKGGKVYVDVPCRTQKQGRRPDVAYINRELLDQFGTVAVLPQSFPLVAEVISPTDPAEDVFAKAKEYLESGCEEVWLVFPINQFVFVMTHDQTLWFGPGDEIPTQTSLIGCKINLNELLSI